MNITRIKGMFKPKNNNESERSRTDISITNEPAWRGEGFPPTGTKVLFCPYMEEDESVFTVVGPYNGKVVIMRGEGRGTVYRVKAENLKPYDAEAERQKAISEIIAAAEQRIDEHAAGLLYDAGYQKQGGNK